MPTVLEQVQAKVEEIKKKVKDARGGQTMLGGGGIIGGNPGVLSNIQKKVASIKAKVRTRRAGQRTISPGENLPGVTPKTEPTQEFTETLEYYGQ